MSTDIAKKLQIKPDSTTWKWPPEHPEPIAEDVTFADDLGSADVAVAFVDTSAQVDEVMTAHRGALAATRVVWFVYAKGGASSVNRDTLWKQVAGYGWKAVANVSYSDALSAVRVRPLKPGEPAAA